MCACNQHAARVTLAPIELPDADSCGNPAAATVAMKITAYTQAQELNFTGATLDSLPADTLQLGVELSTNGSPVAIGKTAPIAEFAELADGTVLPVAMLPPNGFCNAGDMVAPRLHPMIARAGNGVLVVGGLAGGSGAAAEYYDSATATFTSVDVPAQFGSALDGASLATLPDGRVAMSLGQGATVFDPGSGGFSPPSFLQDLRVDHASLALDDTRLLIAGGCASAAGTCGSADLAWQTSVAYTVDADGRISMPTAEPTLPAMSTRFGGALFDPGPLEDGSRRVLLAAASSDPTSGDEIAIDSASPATPVTGMYADATLLDGGAVLSAFALDGSAQTGADSIVPPDVPAPTAAVPALFAPPLDGARLALVEDGTVVAIGDAMVGMFDPTTQVWTQITPSGDAPPPLPGPSLARLPDGSVLVLGGGVTPSATTWLYRPSLTGPNSQQVVALPTGTQGVMTPTSPANTSGSGSTMTLTAPAPAGDLTARALVGGVRTATGTVSASVTPDSTNPGGVVLIAQQTAPGSLLDVQLVAGQTPVIERRIAGAITPLCSSGSIGSADFAMGVAFTVTATTATATLVKSQTTILSCDLSDDPGAGAVGQWGIAATANGAIQVSSVIVSRGQ
jgi:hypothetical protein